MITFDPWTFFVPSFVAAFWAYRINAKKGSKNLKFVVVVALAVLLFGIGIYVE